MSRKGLFLWFQLRSRRRDERGFTVAEAMMAAFILAIGAFAVAQSLGYGLTLTGISRQKTGAEAVANKVMENVRSITYSAIGLRDNSLVVHSNNQTNPDYWVSTSGGVTKYDADGPGSDVPSALVPESNTHPLDHIQTDASGDTVYTEYTYITWYDSPADGLGAADTTDQNGDGVNNDGKLVTVVVVWKNPFDAGGALSQFKTATVISPGIIPSQVTPNQPPTISLSVAVVGTTATFSSAASDPENDTLTYSWDFGDGTTKNSGSATETHTYPNATATYTGTVSVSDGHGHTVSATATVTIAPNINEVQTLQVSCKNNGSVALTFDGGTATVPCPTSASLIQSTLISSSPLGPGDLVVTDDGSCLPVNGGITTCNYIITFQGDNYGGTNVPQITCVPSGAGTTCSSATQTDGVNVNGGGGGGSGSRPSGYFSFASPYFANSNIAGGITVNYTVSSLGSGGTSVSSYRISEDQNNFPVTWASLPSACTAAPCTSTNTWTPPDTSTQGLRTFYIEFKNNANKVSDSYAASITVDTIAPTWSSTAVSVTTPGGKVRLAFTNPTDANTISYQVIGETISGGTWATQTFTGSGSPMTSSNTYSVPSAWQFYVVARDPAGNTSQSVVVQG